MDLLFVVLVIMSVLIVLCIDCNEKPTREGIGGFGATSGINLYNRPGYCVPGRGSFSGGCFSPGYVLI